MTRWGSCHVSDGTGSEVHRTQPRIQLVSLVDTTISRNYVCMELRRTSRLDERRLAEAPSGLHLRAATNDEEVIPRVLAAASERGAQSDQQMSDLLVDAYMPISPVAGRLLHVFALTRRPGRIVEFGTSHGLSTIYLAAATSTGDLPVITTEAEPAKTAAALENFSAVGVADRIDVRAGDAFETLAEFDEPISMLFLDGWKGSYLPLLRHLEDRLVSGAIVVADDTELLPDLCAEYLDYVRSNTSSYVSSSVPVDDGLEVSVVVR
jgi:predicted O-methyltransferase YrrM